VPVRQWRDEAPAWMVFCGTDAPTVEWIGDASVELQRVADYWR
jgi:hypothetical protein